MSDWSNLNPDILGSNPSHSRSKSTKKDAYFPMFNLGCRVIQWTREDYCS